MKLSINLILSPEHFYVFKATVFSSISQTFVEGEEFVFQKHEDHSTLAIINSTFSFLRKKLPSAVSSIGNDRIDDPMFQTAAKEAMAPFVHIEASTSFDWKSCVDDVSRRVLFDTAWSLSVNGTRLLRAETWFLHALSFPLYRDHTPTHSQKLMYIVQSSYEYVSDIVNATEHTLLEIFGEAQHDFHVVIPALPSQNMYPFFFAAFIDFRERWSPMVESVCFNFSCWFFGFLHPGKIIRFYWNIYRDVCCRILLFSMLRFWIFMCLRRLFE